MDIRCPWEWRGGISPTITGDHQDRITDYTAIVVETMDDDKVIGADLYNFALTGGVACTVTARTGSSASASGPSVIVNDEAFLQSDPSVLVHGGADVYDADSADRYRGG